MPKRRGKGSSGAKGSSGVKGSSEMKTKKGKSRNEAYEYVSDDERLYADKDTPDPDSREYFYDDVDEFHVQREKILIDEGYQEDNKQMESDEEEVLALDSSDSDDDEIRDLKAQLRKVNQLRKKSAIHSDIEEDEEEDDDEAGLPDSRAWGQKRKKYYGEEDIVLADIDDEEGDAALEEKEALKLQKQMAEQLDDQDFGLDIFQPAEPEKETTETEQKIVKDLSKLSKREKLQLLKKESPELLTLIDEFKTKLTEVQEKLEPLRTLIEEKKVTGKAADYIHTKFQLNLNYCINIVFYLILKAKQMPVHNHPVIKRLLQYRNLLKQLEPLDIQLKDEITDILSRLSKGEDVSFGPSDEQVRSVKKPFIRRKPLVGVKAKESEKKLSEIVSDSENEESDDMYEDFGKSNKAKVKKSKDEGQYETKDEKAALDYYKMMRSKQPVENDDSDDDDADSGADNMEIEGDVEKADNDLDEEGKRAITYQIEKNKGLTARKKKELRNPRVKHRMKFKKAKTRRKGQIREVRTEVSRYGGELSGIRAGIKRGIKLK